MQFPPSYVVHICNCNGGTVEVPPDSWFLYPIYDTSDKKRIKRTCNDVVRETEYARSYAGFPSSAVAIGNNGGGDHLVLIPLVDDPKRLSHDIYWWDHETGALAKLADDFNEL